MTRARGTQVLTAQSQPPPARNLRPGSCTFLREIRTQAETAASPSGVRGTGVKGRGGARRSRPSVRSFRFGVGLTRRRGTSTRLSTIVTVAGVAMGVGLLLVVVAVPAALDGRSGRNALRMPIPGVGRSAPG